MRPVLFLDMDGVLNSARFFDARSKRAARRAKGAAKAKAKLQGTGPADCIDPDAVPHLNAIVIGSGCRVVLSTSWRHIWALCDIAEALRAHGFVGEVVGATPVDVVLPVGIEEHARGHEIQAWLNAHPSVPAFAILDDCDDMAHLLPRLVRTPGSTGLGEEHVAPAVALLSERSA